VEYLDRLCRSGCNSVKEDFPSPGGRGWGRGGSRARRTLEQRETHVVTGAFGYSGKFIANRLLKQGVKVKTLTGSLHRKNPFGNRMEAHPFNFDEPDKLAL
jgi:hypothetical protein